MCKVVEGQRRMVTGMSRSERHERGGWGWRRAVVLLGWVFLSVAIVLLPDRMVLPGAPEGWAFADLRRVEVVVEDAVLVGRHWEGGRRDADGPLVLVFGGNAMNAVSFGGMIAQMLPDYEVVAVNYRGYGDSTGTPRLARFDADTLAVYDALPSSRPVVVVGASIGSAAAAHLLAQRPVQGAVLITPFDDLRAVARDHVGVAAWLLRTNLVPAQDLESTTRPVVLLSASLDTLFGPDRIAAVRAAARTQVQDVVIEGAGHNSLYGHADFPEALRAAVVDVVRGADGGDER